ncbi:MAG: hypothetical protein IOD08_22290 [Bradyrhizobium sp.]|uniref:hypothetical protein n=1 Tax=Bradyrhizobium sp. TaxID=376 RepID=UPI0025BF29B8|nr:hypothetical protein [Bradyrhizobium sp.]MCA3580004.1 hypothetical protein [Bradyrhizobium sp.]
MDSVLTIGVLLKSPSFEQLEWLRDLAQRVSDQEPRVSILASIHTLEIEVTQQFPRNTRIMVSPVPLSYDENVANIAQSAETPFWMLLGADDVVDIGELPRLADFLAEQAPGTQVVALSRRPVRRDLSSVRVGFLSAFVFASSTSRIARELVGRTHGWLHNSIVFRVIGSGGSLVFFDAEIIDEDLQPGFIKPWTRFGEFVRFQVSFARLVNWLCPNAPFRAALERQSLGRWPFDLFKAVVQGVRLRPSERRFVRVWFMKQRREIGLLGVVGTFARQAADAVAGKLSR